MASKYTPVFDQDMARKMVVAANEGNELANTEFTQDIETAPYGYLVDKYGKEVADQRRLYTQERVAVERATTQTRDAAQIAGDSANAVASGFVNTVGSIAGVAIGGVGLAVDKATGYKGVSDYAVDYIDTTNKVTGWMKSFQSEELKGRQDVSQVEGGLDTEDNLAEFNRQTNDGKDATFVDNLKWFGRGTINNLERVGTDAAIASDVVFEGLGSMGPSVKMAAVASNLVTRTATFNAAKIANAIAPTQGTKFLAMGADAVNRTAIASAVGVSEASGVYAQTVNEILGMKHGELMETSETYSGMIAAGIDPDDAKSTLAANAGMDAFTTSFPQAAALGIIAGKFEAAPLKSFRGSGFIGGLRQVGAQTLEEGGQGLTGQIATNRAIADNDIDPDRGIMKGADEALAVGMIAGTGMAGVMGAPSVFRAPDRKAGPPETAEDAKRRIDATTTRDKYTNQQMAIAESVVESRLAILGNQQDLTEAEANELGFLKKEGKNTDLVAQAYGLLSYRDQRKAPAPEAPTPIVKSPASKAVSALASAAATGLDMTATVASAVANTRAGQATVAGIDKVSSKIAEKATPVFQAGNAKVADFNTRPNRKDQVQTLATVAEVIEMSAADTTPSVVGIARQQAGGVVPSTFAPTTTGNTTLERVSGIITKLSEKGVRINKMDDSDVVYAATEMQRLKNSIPNLPEAIQKKVKQIFDSEDFRNIQVRAARVDLNINQKDDVVITPNVVAESKMIAASNPIMSNPVVLGRVLEQDDRTDVSSEDIKVMKSAQRIGLAIKTRAEAFVNVRKQERVELSLKPDYQGPDGKALPPVDNVEAITRNIFLGQGETKAPSVGKFAADIMSGAQSADGKVVDDQGNPIDVADTVSHFTNFTKHMINKVSALNVSWANRNDNGNGTPEAFENLGSNREMQSGRTENGAFQGRPVTYQGASPKGVRFAGEMYADAVATVEVYNALAEAFPERFPEGQLTVEDYAPTVVDAAPKTPAKPKAPTAPVTPTPADGSIEALEAEIAALEAKSIERFKAGDVAASDALDMQIDALKSVLTTRKGDAAPTEKSSAELMVEKYQNNPEITVGVEINNDLKSLAGYSKENDTVYLNLTAIVADFNAGLTYIDGNGETTSEQKEVVFENIDVQKFKDFIKEGGAELYVQFIIEHELQHRVQIADEGQVYPKDLMDPLAIAMERDANKAGYKAIGFTPAVPSVAAGSISEKSFDNVSPVFNQSFLKRKSSVTYADGDGILAMVKEQPNTEQYMIYMGLFKQRVQDEANNRLATLKVNKSKKGELSVKERIIAGDEEVGLYRRNKNTIAADTTTGEYDPDLLSIAVVAVLDWLSGARSNNVKDIGEMLEDMNLTYDMLTSDNVNTLMNGILPRDAAESLAKDIVRMWGMRINPNARMVDARGAAEGLAKEILEAVLTISDQEAADGNKPLLVRKMVPYVDPDNAQEQRDAMANEAIENGIDPNTLDFTIAPVDQIIFDTSAMREYQNDIGLTGQEAAKKMLAPELDTMPSIGAPSARSDTQSSAGSDLSKMERKALRTMETQGHEVDVPFVDMIEVIGEEALADYLGRKDVSELDARHPLRASMSGKNLSIERDMLEGMSIINAVRNSGFTVNGMLPKVFYRVGISRVGRHQFKGMNPQNNKFLRNLVSPTKSLLDMTKKRHNNAFWLTVAQAADISGYNKVESQHHKFLLENIQQVFQATYGDAVDMAISHLTGGPLDGPAFIKAMGGGGSMHQMAAVFAVAQLAVAEAEGTSDKFTTTLAFELDGKTDGPGNMMANFGQGILSEMDFDNFKRVGFFLGTKNMTLNKFFGDGDQHDLYEVTSQEGEIALYKAIQNGKSWDKKQFLAIARMASAFGELRVNEKGEFTFTRNASKNPMTKTVYGSSQGGIGKGLAQDIIMAMYEMLINNPDGLTEAQYPGGNESFVSDFQELFSTNEIPSKINWKVSWLSEKQVQNFTESTTQTLGKVLSESAKNVIGTKITKVTDTLVLMTAFQTEFLVAKFTQLLDAKIAERVADGSIKTNSKGVPDRSSMTQADYDSVVAQIRKYSPTYANGMQTLDIGSMSASSSGIKLSESMSNTFQSPSTMITPNVAGVKVIPYITQGRGDAMMMNWIYGSENNPDGTLAVFDGINMPIDKIADYSQFINEAVLKNWEADVFKDIVDDADRFINTNQKPEDEKLLNEAWQRAYSGAVIRQTTATATTVSELLSDLVEMQRQNQARKTVFKKIGISVDHMGGSGTAFTQGPDGREYSRGEINDMIRAELGEYVAPRQFNSDGSIDGTFSDVTPGSAAANAQFQITDQSKPRKPAAGEFSKLVVTDAATVMSSLLSETRLKGASDAVRILMKANLKTRIIIGSPEEVSQWYKDNIGDMKKGLKQDKKGIYDPENDVMLITDNNHETLVHELIHAATFKILEQHYDGGKVDGTVADAISRLETLSQEFMDMDFSKSTQEVQDSANSAKAQIIALQVQDDAFFKAAALNEMMAWTLSNEGLMKELGQKQTSVMARMTKVLKALMARLLGGVKSDMLSNIAFNTELLINPTALNTGTPAVTPPTSNPQGQLTGSAAKLTNFWIDLAAQRLDEASAPGQGSAIRSARVGQIGEYRVKAQSALDTLNFGGFTLSAYQQETFKAIHMVLAMEMRLNPQSASALNDMFAHVTDNLTPAMFGPTNEQMRYSAIMEVFGATNNDEGVSDAIAVLLALSQTSRGFRAAIEQLPSPESVKGFSGESANDFLTSVTGMLMNKAIGTIDMSNQSITDTMDQLAESILLEESEKEFRILSRLMSSMNRADQFGNGLFKKLAGFTENVNTDLRNSNRSKLTKLTFGTITAATAFLDQERADIMAQNLKSVAHAGNNLDFAVPIREFLAEIIGTDETNARITAMLDEVTYSASSVRQNFREDLPIIFQEEFANQPTAEQWRAGQKVMGSTDFSLIYDQSRPNTSFELLRDENLIDDEILIQEGAIRAAYSAAVADVILEKAEQLAVYMNTKVPAHQLWRNAYAINNNAGEFDATMTEDIDKLITYYAMKKSDPEMRKEVVRMYDADPVAMQNLAVYMKALNKEEDAKVISEEAQMNGFKGFMPDQGQLGSKVIIAKDDERRSLEKMGYKRVGDATADTGFSSVNRGYYATTTKQTGTYSQGAMQLIQDTYRGVDATTGMSVNGSTSGLITGAAVASLTRHLNNLTSGLANDKEAFLPVYDRTGVLHYERYINPDMIELYTAPKSNLANSMGAWAGRQVEEKFAQKYNQGLIDQLHKTYVEREKDDDNQYINLPMMAKAQKRWDNASASERLKLKKPDRVYVESWNVISPQTKRYIETVFGKDAFYIRKDQMNIALGYRDPSVIDLWTGNTRVPDAVREGVQAITGIVMGDNAMRNLAFIEKGVQGLVSTAKDLIVVRSLVVPYMNTQANVVQLSTRGVPFKRQVAGYKAKLLEIEKFNLNVKYLMRIDTRIQLAGTDTNKVRILEGQKKVILDENKRMSIAPMIEAGAYKNISEGLTDLDVEITGGRLGDWVEKQVDKIPYAGVRTIAKYGILSKDTAIYKGANKAVQYGDFIAKSIYYDHLLDQKIAAPKALSMVNEEFVNFSVLPGRSRQYLEGIGATWFLAFKIRIMKIAMNQIRENPARALVLGATIAEYGSPLNDNLASVWADDRLGYALGWEMLFESPGLNPILNATD
jgi:hypothetical protein